MRAAIVEEIGKVSIKDIPKPSPGYEEALVKISTAGVCHSDLHMALGDWQKAPTPFPLGHEGIGIVEELGPGAESFIQKGDRVIFGVDLVNIALRENLCFVQNNNICSEYLVSTFLCGQKL